MSITFKYSIKYIFWNGMHSWMNPIWIWIAKSIRNQFAGNRSYKINYFTCSRKLIFWIRRYKRDRMFLVFLMEKQSENVDKINDFTLCRTRYIKFDTLMENTWLNGLTVQLHDGFRFREYEKLQFQMLCEKHTWFISVSTCTFTALQFELASPSPLSMLFYDYNKYERLQERKISFLFKFSSTAIYVVSTFVLVLNGLNASRGEKVLESSEFYDLEF